MARHVLFLLLGLVAACSAPAASNPGAVPAVEGSRLFKAKGCYACHTLGQGVKVGPDLQGLFSRRDETWVRRYLSDPVTMAAQDPVARQLKDTYKIQMPKMLLTPHELEQLLAYLRTADSQSSQTR